MPKTKLGLVVACFILLVSVAPDDVSPARAQEAAGAFQAVERIATTASPTEGSSADLDDPWEQSELLEPPIGDPWRAPQQQDRGPRGGQAESLVYKTRITPHWFHGNTRFWFRNDLAGGTREFILVDAETGSRTRAFDHEKLATALSKAGGGTAHKADRLPFDAIEFAADAKSIRFQVDKDYWTCAFASYECTKSKDITPISHDTAAAGNQATGRGLLGATARGKTSAVPGRRG